MKVKTLKKKKKPTEGGRTFSIKSSLSVINFSAPAVTSCAENGACAEECHRSQEAERR